MSVEMHRDSFDSMRCTRGRRIILAVGVDFHRGSQQQVRESMAFARTYADSRRRVGDGVLTLFRKLAPRFGGRYRQDGVNSVAATAGWDPRQYCISGVHVSRLWLDCVHRYVSYRPKADTRQSLIDA